MNGNPVFAIATGKTFESFLGHRATAASPIPQPDEYVRPQI
jgi:hypothetical protein